MKKIKKLLEKYKKIEGERFFEELFTNREYKLVRKVKSDIVVDVGACAGEFSAYIYDKAKVIYAIEPYSQHFEELTGNIKEFNLTKIKPFNLALSNENGEGNLILKDRGGHMLSKGNGERVKTKTLATFMKENKIKRIDILKIDIEGGENEVFNSDDFKEIAGRVKFIIGEHLGGVDGLLKSLGYKKKQDRLNSIYKR